MLVGYGRKEVQWTVRTQTTILVILWFPPFADSIHWEQQDMILCIY